MPLFPHIATLVAAFSLLQMPAPVNPLANQRAAGPLDGITVSAAGYAQGPADSASFRMYLFAKKGQVTEDMLKPAIDAMVAGGVTRDSISVSGQGIEGTIDHPDAAKLQAALPAVIAAFGAIPDVTVSNANVQLYLTDCARYAAKARDAAIANARVKAEAVAKSLGVAIGPVKAFNDVEPPGNAEGQCVNAFMLPNYGQQEPRTPADFLTVRIVSTVTMRYAIK